MIGVIVVTHGELANELVNAANTIVGDLPQLVAVSIGWHDDPAIAREAIERAIREVDGPSGVLILTDMFGGRTKNCELRTMNYEVRTKFQPQCKDAKTQRNLRWSPNV